MKFPIRNVTSTMLVVQPHYKAHSEQGEIKSSFTVTIKKCRNFEVIERKVKEYGHENKATYMHVNMKQ